MENENIVKFECDDGKCFEMIILKEFPCKEKKYAVLMDKDNCNCDSDCSCGCKEEKECTCSDHECKENNCDCNETGLYILEISKDKEGNEIFKEIEDEKTFNEVIEEADKVLYEI